MQVIITTDTALSKIKIRARGIQKEQNISLHAAQEIAAHEAGYESWFHVCWCVKQPAPPASSNSDAEHSAREDASAATAAREYMEYLAHNAVSARLEHFPVRGDMFHAVEIDGAFFYGAVGVDGPAIIHKSARLRGYERGWVQLGGAEINYTAGRSTNSQDGVQPGWAVCKYGPSEPRIWISGLSPQARFALAHEFGVPLHFPFNDPIEQIPTDAKYCPFSEGGMWLFKQSPAFQSLVSVAKAHPRKARTWEANAYLGYWGRTVRLAAGCPRPDDITPEV